MAVPVFVELKATISDFESKMGAAKSQLENTAAKGQASFDKLAGYGKAALLGIGTAAVSLGTAAVHLADQWETSRARLQTAIVDAGNSFDLFKGQIGQTDSSMEKLGFTNAQTEDALSRLVTAVHDPTLAMKDLAVAADLARARGMDLTTAAQLVGRAAGGTYTALLRLGIVTKDQAAAFKSGADAVDYLGKAFSGQAQAYAKTFGGQMQVLKATVEDLGARIGIWLIPKIEAVAKVLDAGVKFLQTHREAAVALGVALTTLLIPALVETTAKLAVMIAEAAAAAAPFAAIILPVAALSLGLYELGAKARETGQQIKTAGDSFAQSFEQSIANLSYDERVKALTDEIGRLALSVYDAGGAAEQAAAAHIPLERQLDINRTAAQTLKGDLDKLKAAHEGAAAGAMADAQAAGVAGMAVEDLKTIQEEGTKVTKDEAAAVNDLKSALDNLVGIHITADEKALAFNKDIIDLTKSFRENGASIDSTTEKGIANREAIDRTVSAILDQIDAMKREGKSTEDINAVLGAHIGQLEGVMHAAGLTDDQIKNYEHTLGLVPGDISTVLTVNDAQATSAIQNLEAQLRNLPTFIPITIPVATSPVPHAAGGPVTPGVTYLVGERGPELLQVGARGTVIPNNQIGSGGGGLTVNVTIPGGVVIGSGGMTQLADAIRRELLVNRRGLVSVGLA